MTDALLIARRHRRRGGGARGRRRGLARLAATALAMTNTGYRCCDDCGVPKPAGPMLYDSLWRTISPENPWLCFDCTEKRLGRPLTQADLKPCRYNRRIWRRSRRK
jgi:hypothetical protein